jgi:tetratricopeptide (TPR) repeat protein
MGQKVGVERCDSLLTVDSKGALQCYNNLYKSNALSGSYEKLLDAHLFLEDSSSAWKLARKQAEQYGNSRANYYVDYWVLSTSLGKSKPDWTTLENLVKSNPFGVRNATRRLEHYGKIQEAVDLMVLAEKTNSKVNTAFERAQLHAQLGQHDLQYHAYFDAVEENAGYYNAVQMKITQNINGEENNVHNAAVKRVLYDRLAEDNDPRYEDLLLYVFRQEGNFEKAFRYLKGKARRGAMPLQPLMKLGAEAAEAEEHAIAEEVFALLMSDVELMRRTRSLGAVVKQRHANASRLGSEGAVIMTELESAYPLGVCEECFGWELYRSWFMFTAGRLEVGGLMEELATIRTLYPREELQGRTYLKSGDAQLSIGQYDDALLDYARAEKKLGDSPDGDVARLKKALCAFYRGDIAWAKTQLEVLLQSTSKDIANDAMETALLIASNTVEDTAMEGLILIREAMLFEAQGQLDSALAAYERLSEVLIVHELYDDVNYKLGRVAMELGQFQKALSAFNTILLATGDGLWYEDALFHKALAASRLNDPNTSEVLEAYLIAYPNGLYAEKARALYRTFAL